MDHWYTHTSFLQAKPFYQNITNLHTRKTKRIPAGLGRFRQSIVGFWVRDWCIFSVGLLFGGRELAFHCVPEQTPFFHESDFISCCSSGSVVLFSVWISGSIKPKQQKLISWTLITPLVLYYSTTDCFHSSLCVLIFHICFPPTLAPLLMVQCALYYCNTNVGAKYCELAKLKYKNFAISHLKLEICHIGVDGYLLSSFRFKLTYQLLKKNCWWGKS